MSDDLRENAHKDVRDASTSESQADSPATRPPDSAARVLQRTADAISPWVRRWWVGSAPSVSAPSASTGAAVQPVTSGRVPGQTPLALRVQRLVSASASFGGNQEMASRLSHSILQRHAVAEQIGRRYRTEMRQPATPAPAQLPLPGVRGSERVQRASGEMSLEDLARSYQSAPDTLQTTASPEAAISPEVVQRASERAPDSPSTAFGSAPTTLTEMQDAVRRTAQMRPAPVESVPERVQRTPEDGAGNSMFSAISERIRQAREGASTTAPSQPAPSTSTPSAVQRTPESAPSSAPTSPAETGNSIAAAIQARIREARERLASGGSAPTPPPVQRTPAANTPAPNTPAPNVPPPLPATPAEASFAAPAEVQRMPGPGEPGWEDVPRELPHAPTLDSNSPGYSRAEAVRERIQRARNTPKALPTAEDIQRQLDPNSPDFSKAEAVRQRIEQARLQRQETVHSADPSDPNYSVSEQIRQRIEAQRAQRQPARASGETPASTPPATPSVTPANSVTPADPDVQRAPDTRHAIMRDLQMKPSPLDARQGPPQAKRVRALSRSQILTPERKTGDFLAGETPRPGATPLGPSSTVQRTSSAPSGSVPPEPPTSPPVTPESGVASATPVPQENAAAPVQREVEESADEASDDLAGGATLRRAVAPDTPSDAAPLDARSTDGMATDLAPTGSTPVPVQRTPDVPDAPMPVAQTPVAPGKPAIPPAVQRAVEPPVSASSVTSPATSPATSPMSSPSALTPRTPAAQTPASATPASESSPPSSVQRAVGPTSPSTSPAMALPTTEHAPEAIQRTLDSPRESVPNQPVAPSPGPNDTEISAATSAPESIQRMPDMPTENVAAESSQAAIPPNAPTPAPQTGTPSPTAPPAPEAVQRTPDLRAKDMHIESESGAPEQSTAPASATPPAAPSEVQRTVEATPSVVPPFAPTPRAPESAARAPEANRTVSPDAPDEPSTPPVVQRVPEHLERVPEPPVIDPPAAPTPVDTSPAVQRTSDLAESGVQYPTPAAPAELQRTVDAPIEPAQATDSQAEGAPASSPTLPAVQRAVDPGAATLPAPEAAQRTSSRADAPESAPSVTPSVPPVAQRVVEPSAPAPAIPDAGTTAEHAALPTTSEPGPHPPVLPSEPASSVASLPEVQRSLESPVPVPAARTPTPSSEPDSPIAPSSASTSPASTSPASTSSATPAAAQVQRSPEVSGARTLDAGNVPAAQSSTPAASPTVPQPTVSETNEQSASAAAPVQRAPDAPVTRTPVSPDAPSTLPPIQRLVAPDVDVAQGSAPLARDQAAPTEASGVSATPQVAASPASSTQVTPDRVQRAAESHAEAVSPPPTTLPPTMPSPTMPSPTTPFAPFGESATLPTVQRTVEERPMPEVVQRTSAAPSAPLPTAPDRVTPAPEAASPAHSTPSTPAPEQVQRKAAAPIERAPDIAVPEPSAPDAAAPSPTAPSTAAPQSTVQRSVESVPPVAPSPAPTASESTQVNQAGSMQAQPTQPLPVRDQPDQVQRTPDTSVARATAQPEPQAPKPQASRPQVRDAQLPEPPGGEIAPPATPPAVQRSVDVRTPLPKALPPLPKAPPPLPREPEPPMADLSVTTPLETTVQRAPAREAGARPSLADELERRFRAANPERFAQAEPPAGTSPSSKSPAPTAIQRAPSGEVADWTPPWQSTEAPALTVEPPVEPPSAATLQRSAQTSAPRGTQSSAAVAPAPGQVKASATKASASHESATNDGATFHPINRYRDPRVLARAVEPNQPRVQHDLPLSHAEPAAVLPQARALASLPLANARIQRTDASEPAEQGLPFGSMALSEATSALPVPGVQTMRTPPAQRVVKEKGKTVEKDRPARKVRSVEGSAAAKAPSVRRQALPLAKRQSASASQASSRTQRSPSGETIQRTPTSTSDSPYVGATAAHSGRGLTQVHNLNGTEGRLVVGEQNGDTTTMDARDRGEGERERPAPDLDRLARAILPVVKRMLAIERDRRSPRPLF